MKIKALFVTLLVLITNGCVGHLWTAPGFRGQVIDAETKTPLENVEVIRTARGEKPALIATTAADGSFQVKGKGKIVFVIPIGGDPLFPGDYVFRKSGYIDEKFEYSMATGACFARKPWGWEEVIKLHPCDATRPATTIGKPHLMFPRIAEE